MTSKKPGTDEDGAAIRTDLELGMASAGLRGVLLDPESGSGFRLTGKTDAMVVQTASGRGRSADGGNLPPARATVSRLRLGLEGSRPIGLGGGATLTPSLEIGVRHDDGDAETGFGLDLGGGLALSDPGRGLEAELRGRGLLSHESKGFRDLGFSGSLAWEGKPSSDRGAKLTLTQTVGGTSSGGADALLSRTTLDGLAANENGEENRDLKSRRLELKFGYGFSAFGDRFTWTPRPASACRIRGATTASAGGWCGADPAAMAARSNSPSRHAVARAPMTTPGRSTRSACGSRLGSDGNGRRGESG